MRYREIKPKAADRAFVECYWTMEHEGGEPVAVQKVVPDGYPELILNLGRPFECLHDDVWRVQPGCFLAGQITGPMLLRPSGAAHLIGVRFLPQGAGQWLGLPMQELAGRTWPIAELSPALARRLAAVLESPAPLVNLQATLSRAPIAEDLLVSQAVRWIAVARGAHDVGSLANHLGIGWRQLERRFASRVGLPPKLFSRIQRFFHVFQHVQGGSADWADTAAACGYYDQAHLIRDFKDFSGATPTVLLAEDALARHFLRSRSLSDSSMSDLSKTRAGRSG
jgi:AraC-like DNA-binding protein